MAGLKILCHLRSGTPGQSKPPVFLAFRSSTGFILTTVCLAVFTDIFLYGLIVPVFPYSLTHQVGIAEDHVQAWTAILLACYSLPIFVASPVAGIYADHSSSRRFPLLLGLLALAGSTLLLCLSRTIALLILGRVLQGLSAAVVWSVGLALLADTMGKNVGMGMGYVNIAMSVGLLISPLIGGAAYQGAGYYAVYFIAFALLGCDIVLRLVMVEKKVAQRWIDAEEGTELEVAATALPEEPKGPAVGAEKEHVEVGKKDEAAAEPTTDEAADVELPVPISASADASTAAAAPATSAEGRPRRRHAHWTLLKSRRMMAALFGCVIQAGLMFAFDTVVPLFVKTTFAWSSTAAGLLFLCVFVPGFISPWVGTLTDRHGAKWLSLAGFVSSVPVLVCLRFVAENTTPHKVLLAALLTILGTTLTFSYVPLMAEITFAIDAIEARHPGIWGDKGVYGIGYGLFTTSFALGGAVGSLMAGYVNDGAGWGTATWVLAIWCAAGAMDVALWVGGPHPRNVNTHDVEGVQGAAPAGETSAG